MNASVRTHNDDSLSNQNFSFACNWNSVSTSLSQIDGANSDWYDSILSPCRIDGALWHRKLEGSMWIVAVQNMPSSVITLNHKHSTKKMNRRLIKSTSAVNSVMRLALDFMAQIKITRTDLLFSLLETQSIEVLMRNYRTQERRSRGSISGLTSIRESICK